jgi:hypothetical protein
MHTLIYHLVKHLIRGLVILVGHFVHHAPAAHSAVRHAVTAHSAVRQATTAHAVAARTFGGVPNAAGASTMTAMPAAQGRAIPLSSMAASLHAQNVQSGIMASVGQEQAAAVPDVGDFSY